MKKIISLLFVLFSTLTFAGIKEDAKALAKSGVEFIVSSKSEQAAFKIISDPKGKFVKGDLYVFVIDHNGKVLAHIKDTLIDKSLLSLKDGNNVAFVGQFIEISKLKGSGWVEYLWPKPNDTKASKKTSYIERVPGKEYFVGVGYYEDSKGK